MPGRLTLAELEQAVAEGTIDTVVVAQVDMQGRLMGKRFQAEFFLESAHQETHSCNYLLATDETQTFKRKMLFMKLGHALDKHAHAEEMVVYPALREANETADADHLEGEHGYIKTFIFELNEMGPDGTNWLEKVREFRQLVSEHAHMEEEEVFPKFKKAMTKEQNAHITSLVNRDGFWMA